MAATDHPTVIPCGNCKRPVLWSDAIYDGETMRRICPCCRMKMVKALPFVEQAERINAYGR